MMSALLPLWHRRSGMHHFGRVHASDRQHRTNTGVLQAMPHEGVKNQFHKTRMFLTVVW